ncbi:MAG: ABC transporter permease subunit [Proteobacteria bacterium]|nr:ABC transporter permease subunit [Pseudomonadota bacterium]
MKKHKLSFHRPLLAVYVGAVIVFLHAPALSLLVSSFSADKYFHFPFAQLTTRWYVEMFLSGGIRHSVANSVITAISVMIPTTVLGFLGALAFARFKWKGRGIYQKFLLLPIFFPQLVLGLSQLLLTNFLSKHGLVVNPSWITAGISHMVWMLPIVTMVIAIQVYGYDVTMEEAAYDLGATTWQVYKEVTLPVLLLGIVSGALFAFLLSWSDFELSLFLQGPDQMLPVYIYGKMVGGFSPTAPALSATVYVLSAAALFVPFWFITRAST